MQRFEAIEVGQDWSPGRVTVTEEEILAFAETYDPQPFHVDAEAAQRRFGGLIASGWHTAALCMRPFAEHVLDDVAIVAAVGVEDLRWPEPVRPGDTIDVAVRVEDKDPWDEDRGLVTFRVTGHDGDGELVHSRNDLVLVKRERSADEQEERTSEE